MATKEANPRSEQSGKLSIRLDLQTRDDLKSVAGALGLSVEKLVRSLIDAKLESMHRHVQAIRQEAAR